MSSKEYMRKYNATPKGAAYNRKHIKEWRKRTKTPHSNRNITKGYRNIIIDYLIKRDGLICGICKQSLENSKIHINHIIPVALGGQDIMDNVNLAHEKCNISQSNDIRKQSQGY